MGCLFKKEESREKKPQPNKKFSHLNLSIITFLNTSFIRNRGKDSRRNLSQLLACPEPGRVFTLVVVSLRSLFQDGNAAWYDLCHSMDRDLG